MMIFRDQYCILNTPPHTSNEMHSHNYITFDEIHLLVWIGTAWIKIIYYIRSQENIETKHLTF